MIETARLLLRQHVAEDYEACFAMTAEPEVTKYIGGKPMTREEAWQRLLRNAGLWGLTGYGPFAIIEKSSGRFVGDTGHMATKRGLGEGFDGHPEGGWLLAAWSHGKGYATEAALAAHEWFDRVQGRQRNVCIIDPSNLASFRVAAKLGYSEFRRADYHGGEVVMLAREAGG